MFSLKVVDTDMFLDMSPSAQNLYFHLGMRADDDGFVSSPKKIMVMVNASEDDMRVLLAKNFVIKMATNGIAVITHWHTNNLIRPDRYQETEYKEEKNRLNLSDGKYNQDFGLLNVIPNGNQMATQVRLGKDSIGKDKEEVVSLPSPKGFKKPSIQEIQEYCTERSNGLNPEQFFDFYESKGWKVGSQTMKDWRAAVRTWEQRNRSNVSNDEAIDIEEVIRQKKLKQCQK